MTPSTESPIPAPDPEDNDDVELALETAGALWVKGDRAEAVRWLRRGAEAAEQAGNDPRALALARTAAELDSQPREPSPAEPAPAPSPVVEAVAAPSYAAPPPPAERASRPPPKPASERITQPPPKPAERVSQAPKPPSERASTVPKPALSPVPEAALRVYVKTSARDDSLLIVRPLEAGRAAPPGTQVATLVFEEQP